MRTIALETGVMICAVLVLSVAVCPAEDGRPSPHSESGDCLLCHVAPADKLRSWFTSGSTKRELKYDLNQVCLQCHTVKPTHAGGFVGVGQGHAIGKKPEINTQNLPVAQDGTITCATTCHNVHVISEDKRLQRKRLRLPVNSLCMSCHNM